jgi:hypothetical protein
VAPNEAVIWDTIITSPSADHLANLGKLAKRKLVESGRGKTVDGGRYVYSFPYLSVFGSRCRGGMLVLLDKRRVG